MAREACGIPEGEYRKPYDKLKKTALQLTLYARILKIPNIAVVEIRKDGYRFYELEMVPEETVKLILKEFKSSFIDMI